MDRTLVYAGQVPRALDNLLLGRFAMVGLAKLAEAVLGTNTVVPTGNFTVTPSGGLNITVGAGQIYQLESIEPTTESALNVDGHQVLKQGVALDAQTLTLAPPSAVGYAQNFLIQVAYQDTPSDPVVLSFQNPTPVLDPSTNAYKYVTYPGPGGNGAQSYTILQGGVSIIAKPGTSAPSGSQTTPPPDAGYVGLYVVTLAYGATSINSGNISAFSAAPFIPVTLPGVPVGVQSGQWTYGEDTGTADNYVVPLTPSTGSLNRGQRVLAFIAHANATTNPVINLGGSGNKPLLLRGGNAPGINDIIPGWRDLFYDGANVRLVEPSTSETQQVVLPFTPAGASKQTAFTQFALTTISGINTDNVAQSLTLTGASYIDILGATSILYNSTGGSSSAVNVTARVQLWSSGSLLYDGDYHIGATLLPQIAAPMTVRQVFQGLNRAASYTLKLVVNKGQAIDDLNVNDAYLIAFFG